MWPTVQGVWVVALVALGIPCLHARADGSSQVHVQLLGLNDFHGQLESTKSLDTRPVGGAAVLVAYLRDASANFEGDSLIVHAGDWVGASPPASALLQDEPAIAVLNALGNRFCRYGARMDPRCNVVGTLGNHEFDEGTVELLRLLRGGNSPRGPFLEDPYRGARFPYVSANVIARASNRPLLPAYVIKRLGGVRVAVIGAVLEETPRMVVAGGVRDVRFVPEAEAINRAVRALCATGVQAIVVSLHQGAAQEPYLGFTRDDSGALTAIQGVISELDDAVDVVISGHAHAFTNTRLNNKNGKAILVTQAWSSGSAFARIDLTLDRISGDVVASRAQIVPTYTDAGPGLTPAQDVVAIVTRAAERTAPLTARAIGTSAVALPQKPNSAGESALGNMIADAQRRAASADIALMNQGGIRAALAKGPITWGQLFAVQPFSNSIVSMELRGVDVARVLEQQWEADGTPHMLHVSGLSYAWDPRRPVGERIVEARVGAHALDPNARYRVAVNSFLAGGGSGFTGFWAGAAQRTHGVDLDLLVAYVASLGDVAPAVEGRIRNVAE